MKSTMRGITGEWNNPAKRRCDVKVAYSSSRKAELKARAASISAECLIVAYECPDCGKFHIGHADLSQKLARTVHAERPCKFCGCPIPQFKKEKALVYNSVALYCSDSCQKIAAKVRKEAREAVRDGAKRK